MDLRVLFFSYAICFSFAYLGLTTATGALILFSSVQFTMILIGLVRGERHGHMGMAWFNACARRIGLAGFSRAVGAAAGKLGTDGRGWNIVGNFHSARPWKY